MGCLQVVVGSGGLLVLFVLFCSVLFSLAVCLILVTGKQTLSEIQFKNIYCVGHLVANFEEI